MGAFRFDFSHDSPRADPARSAALGVLSTAFQPATREVASEGSEELLEELLAKATARSGGVVSTGSTTVGVPTTVAGSTTVKGLDHRARWWAR